MLTDKEVQHIAALARIALSDREEEQFKKELSSILEYIDQLNRVDTDDVQPLYQITGLVNAFRPDEPQHSSMSGEGEPRNAFPMDDTLNERLIGQAPHKEERFIKVKTVLKK